MACALSAEIAGGCPPDYCMEFSHCVRYLFIIACRICVGHAHLFTLCVSRLQKQEVFSVLRHFPIQEICQHVNHLSPLEIHSFVPEMFWTCLTAFLGSKSLVIQPPPIITLLKVFFLWLLFAFSCKNQELLLCQQPHSCFWLCPESLLRPASLQFLLEVPSVLPSISVIKYPVQ